MTFQLRQVSIESERAGPNDMGGASMKKVALSLLLVAAAARPAWSDPDNKPPGDKVSFTEKLLGQIPDDVPVFKDIVFSNSGLNVAYVAIRNGKMHMVLNNQMGPAYTGIADKPHFIKDGKTVVYRASAGTRWHVVVGRPSRHQLRPSAPGPEQVGR